MQVDIVHFHLAAFVIGSLMDLLIGDPHSIPHPVQLIGRLISFLDQHLQKKAETKADGTEMDLKAFTSHNTFRKDEIDEEATRKIGRTAARKDSRTDTGTRTGEDDRTQTCTGTDDRQDAGIEGQSNAERSARKNDEASAAITGKSDELVCRQKRRYGRLMAVIVVGITGLVSWAILSVAYRLHPLIGLAVEAVMTCQILAGRSLERESMKVYDKLQHGTMSEARHAVSMIVGRDTANLTREQVTKAAVETVAENTSDGVIAPMLYTALGGPVLGWMYKAVNTMDSMVGYKNDRYQDFGRGPAHLDDAVNYLPSRLSAILMIAATWLLHIFCGPKAVKGKKPAPRPFGPMTASKDDKGTGPMTGFEGDRWGRPVTPLKKDDKGNGLAPPSSDSMTFYDPANAARIWKRDRRKHASPNSAQTESVMAGALRVQLAGDACYFGKLVKKPFIGDPLRPICPEDIRRANHLMFATAILAELICAAGITAAIRQI